MLWLTKRVIFGVTKNDQIKNLKDVNKPEMIMLGILALLIILFGFYPVPLMETLNVSVDNLINNYETDIKILGLEVGDVTDFQISFNPNYLIQGIEVLDGNKAFLRFSGNDKPAVIQGEEETYQYLLMPVRTNE